MHITMYYGTAVFHRKRHFLHETAYFQLICAGSRLAPKELKFSAIAHYISVNDIQPLNKSNVKKDTL